MARIFTGSSAGLGLIAGRRLAAAGHDVVLHARNEKRAEDVRLSFKVPVEIVIGDLQTIRGATGVAEETNRLGRFDSVIHNAGIFRNASRQTTDGYPAVFAVNVLAPFILTSLMAPADRLIYLSSSMHRGSGTHLDDLLWMKRNWNETAAYSESKFQVLLLTFAVSRLRPDAYVNAVDPGWVPTRMGGAGAPDDLVAGSLTQMALAAPDLRSPVAKITGAYLHHMKPTDPDPRSRSVDLQDEFVRRCTELSGVGLKHL